MAAISNATTKAIVNDTVNQELIDLVVRYATQTPYIFQGIADMATLDKAAALSVPIWANLAAAPSYSTESDEVASAAVTPTAVNISAAEYATGTFLTERAVNMSVQDVQAIAIESIVKALMLQVDTITLALASSISGNQGSNATTNDLANFVSAQIAFMTQAKASSYMPVCVMHPDAVRDLNADLATSGSALLGGQVGQAAFAAFNGNAQGIFREFAGMLVATSDRVPAGDTSGWSNFFVHAGPGESALCVAWARAPGIKTAERPERVGQYIIGSMDVGAGILEQARAYKFITRT